MDCRKGVIRLDSEILRELLNIPDEHEVEIYCGDTGGVDVIIRDKSGEDGRLLITGEGEYISTIPYKMFLHHE